MKVYIAAPLFSQGERLFNERIDEIIRSCGHETFLPQPAATVKASALKKGSKTVAVSKLMTVKDAQGDVTFKKVSATKGGKSFSKKFAVNSKTGTVTVKKGTKKGTYKLKIKVRAAGEGDYLPTTKTVTCTIKVK